MFLPGAEVPADAGHPQVARQVLAATDPADGGPAPPVARAHRLCQRHQEGRPVCPRAREARSPGRLPGQGPDTRRKAKMAETGRETSSKDCFLCVLNCPHLMRREQICARLSRNSGQGTTTKKCCLRSLTGTIVQTNKF